MSGFNYFAANNQFRAQHLNIRQGVFAPPPGTGGGNVSVTNITVNRGSGNKFLDFMNGFVGALGGGHHHHMAGIGGGGGCFGGGSIWGPGFGGGFCGGHVHGVMGGTWAPTWPTLDGSTGLGGLTGTTGTTAGSTTATGEDDKLTNLRKMYSNYYVNDNGDGTYTLSKGNGPEKTGTYEELGKLIKTSEGDDDSQVKNTNENNSNGKVSGNDDGNDDGSNAGGVGTGSGSGSGSGAGGVGNTGKGTGKGGVKVPSGWYRSDTKTGNENTKLNLSSCKNADEVVNKVLGQKMDYLSPQDKAALKQEIINNNPSIFKKGGNGELVATPNWDKLDLPSVDYIKNKYTQGGTKKVANGAVSYTDKSGVQHTRDSGINNSENTKTVKGGNGYYAKYNTSTGERSYFDPDGNLISEDAFKAKCPTIVKNLDRLMNS